MQAPSVSSKFQTTFLTIFVTCLSINLCQILTYALMVLINRGPNPSVVGVFMFASIFTLVLNLLVIAAIITGVIYEFLHIKDNFFGKIMYTATTFVSIIFITGFTFFSIQNLFFDKI